MVAITAGPSSSSKISDETDTEITYSIPDANLNDEIFLSIDTDTIDSVEPSTEISFPGGDVKKWGSDLSESPGQNLGYGKDLKGKKVRVYTTLPKSVDPGHEGSLIYSFQSGNNPTIKADVRVTGKNPTSRVEFFFTTIIFN